MKIKFSILSMLFAFSAVAGSGMGNGGYSVVCRDDKKVITSAELLDVFEGRVLSYYDYSNNPNVTEKDFVDFALANIRKVDTKFAAMVEAEIKLLETRTIYITQELVLEDTNDAFPTIGRRDCKFEQLANYTDDEKLMISTEIHNQLPTLHKAALKVHEAVYYLARKTGQKTSQNARKVTSWSLAVGAKVDEKMAILVGAISKPLMGISIKEVCGQAGNLQERIADCDTTYTTKTGLEWQLISKNAVKSEYFDQKISNLIYLTPSKRIVTLMNFDLSTSRYGNSAGKERANALRQRASEGVLCSANNAKNFIGYPQDVVRGLSVDLKLATIEELNQLLLVEEAAQILNFSTTQNMAFDKTFTGPCDFSEFFRYNSSGSDFGKFRYGIFCQLPVLNARTQVVSTQQVKADTLEVICIE